MRRLFKILGLALAGLLVLLAGAWLLRGPLFAEPLGRLVADQLGAALGGRFTCERVEGTFFRDVAVVGLRTVEPPPDGALAGLDLDRAEVRFRPFDLLGDDPLLAIESVRLDGARVVLDLTRPSPAPDEEAPPPDLAGILAQLPARFPALEVRGRIEVRTAEGPIIAEGLHLRDEGPRTLRLGATRLVLPASLGGPGGLDLTVAIEDDEPAVVVTAHEPLAGISPERVRIAPPLRWEATVAMGAATRIEAAGDLDRASVRLAPFDLADVPAWVRALLPPDADLPARARLTADARVAWAGALEAEGSVTVEDFAWRDYAGERIALAGRYAGGRGTLERLEVRMDGATVDAESVAFDPQRALVVTSIGRFDLAVPDLARFVEGLDRRLGVTMTAGSPDARTLAIESLRVDSEAGTADLSGSAVLPDDPADWEAIEIALDLDARVVDAARIAGGIPAVEGTVTVAGGVRGTVGRPEATLTVRGDTLVVEGRRVQTVAIAAALEGAVLTVSRAEVAADPGRVEASGVVDLDAGTVRDGRYRIEVPDLAGFLALFPGTPAAAGSVSGSGAVAWDGTRPQGDASLVVRGLAVDGAPVGDLDLEASADGGRVTVTRLSVRHPEGTASLTGAADLDARSARIETLAASAAGYEVAASVPFDLAWNEAGDLQATGLDLALLGGRVRGSAGLVGGSPRADLTLEGLDLARIRAEGLDAGGWAAGAVTLGEDRWEVRLEVPALRWQDRKGLVRVHVRQEADGGVRLEELTVEGDGLGTVAGRAHLPWRFGPESGLVHLDAPSFEPELTLRGEVPELARVVPLERGGLTFRVEGEAGRLNAEFHGRDLAWVGHLALPGRTSVSFSADNRGLRADIATQPGGAAVLTGTVRSAQVVDWTRPRALERALEEARLDGQIDLELPDLEVLLAVLEDLPHLQGSGRITASVSGPFREPQVEGRLELQDVTLALGGDLPPMQRGQGAVRFDGRVVTIEGVRGELGYEPFELGGTVDLTGDDPVLDVKLAGRNLLLSRSRHVRLRADVSLALAGPLPALRAAGVVDVTDALISQPMALTGGGGGRTADDKLQLFSIREGPLSTMRLDVEVRGDRTVRLVNNVVVGRFSPALRIGGTGAVPEPVGSVFFQDTLVKLEFSSLKVDQGELRFTPENPFAPVVNVRAHTRMRGYDLTVRTSGEVPEVEVFVSAVPALSQEDAIILLATGSLPADFEGAGGGRTALTKVGSMVGRRLLDSLSGPSDPDEETIFDRIEVEIGRDISRDGNETVEGEFRMTPRWYLRLERDRYDEYNGGIVWRIRFR